MLHTSYPSILEGEGGLAKKEEMGTELVYSKLQLSPRNEKQACENVSVCPILLPTNNTFLWDLPQVTMRKTTGQI